MRSGLASSSIRKMTSSLALMLKWTSLCSALNSTPCFVPSVRVSAVFARKESGYSHKSNWGHNAFFMLTWGAEIIQLWNANFVSPWSQKQLFCDVDSINFYKSSLHKGNGCHQNWKNGRIKAINTKAKKKRKMHLLGSSTHTMALLKTLCICWKYISLGTFIHLGNVNDVKLGKTYYEIA